MGSFVVQVMLGLFWLGLVVALVVLLQRRTRLLTRWPFRAENGERPTAESVTLEEEIATAQRRLEALETPGGAAEWMSRLLVWRQRRILTDLCRRRRRLFAEEKRWLARAKGVRLPSATLPAPNVSIRAARES